MRRRLAAVLAASCLLLPLAPGTGNAVSISYLAVDVPDLAPGENLFRYDYSLDAFPYPADFGFSVLFDPTLYDGLQSPPPAVGSDWDIISLQPDVSLPADGVYDSLALVGNPSTLSGFSVEFVWLGPGTPGSQPFVVYDDEFETVQSGETVLVPEPGTLGLAAGGLAVPRTSPARPPDRWRVMIA